MLQPGYDALGRHLGYPGRTRDRATVAGDPVAEQRPGVGGSEVRARGAEVARATEIVQCMLQCGGSRLNQQRRAASCLDDLAGKGKAAMVELFSDLRIGRTQVLRGNEHAFGRKAGEAPAIERPHAHAPAETAPKLRRRKSPQL